MNYSEGIRALGIKWKCGIGEEVCMGEKCVTCEESVEEDNVFSRQMIRENEDGSVGERGRECVVGKFIHLLVLF